jgi:hypothetical protein
VCVEVVKTDGLKCPEMREGRAWRHHIDYYGITFLYMRVSVEVVKTDGLKCPEMREGRAWRHHIDYYGIAATAYLLLFGTYMEVIKVSIVMPFAGFFMKLYILVSLLWIFN